MTDVPVQDFDPRTPRPEPHFNVLGALGAATVAALVYILALYSDVTPPQGVAVGMFAATPLFAGVALLVLQARARAERDPRLAWVAAGLAVSVVAIVLQFISFPAVAAGGGIFSTGNQSSAGLYLYFHVAFALGAACGALGVPDRWRRAYLVVGIAGALALALDLVPMPMFVDAKQGFTSALHTAQWAVAVVVAVCTITWIVRVGRAPRSLLAWIGIALSLTLYDVVLNGLASRRFDEMWWASLTLRWTSYGVLALGVVTSVLRRLSSWERYTDAELDRRESQLRDSLGTTQELLRQVTERASVLQQQLLPHALVASRGVTVTARYRGAGAYDRIGGDWYDTIPLPSGGLALVIGDVEGHDLAAASLMGQIRASVRSYALEGHPPSIVLRRVNAFLMSTGNERLVTMAYAELYPDDRLMTMAIAGHPAPLLIATEWQDAVAMDVPIDLPLGVQADARWSERTVQLPVGVTVLMYTDGLLDAPGTTRDVFASVSELARSHPSLEALVDALVASVAAPAYDDIAVLGVQLSSTPRRSVGRTLPVEPMSASIARVWLSDLASLWIGRGSIPDTPVVRDRVEVAQLLLTELVSNAIRHSEYALEVQIDLADTVLRVDVVDTSHRMPVLLAAGAAATSGRGLRLVEMLATSWGIDAREHGKSVWFTLELAAESSSEFDEDALLASFSDSD